MARSPYFNLCERLIANTEEPENAQGCWPWKRQRDRWGYGRFTLYVDGVIVKLQAHIALWVWFHAQPESIGEFVMAYWFLTATGLELDHLCENEGCCNPEHLDLVTGSENCQRREDRSRFHALDFTQG
jgi:hypothetical protein